MYLLFLSHNNWLPVSYDSPALYIIMLFITDDSNCLVELSSTLVYVHVGNSSLTKNKGKRDKIAPWSFTLFSFAVKHS